MCSQVAGLLPAGELLFDDCGYRLCQLLVPVLVVVDILG